MIVYSAKLLPYPNEIPPALLNFLSETEQGRLNKMRDIWAKREFLSGRVILRSVLSVKLGLAPEEVPIGISAGGRPYLSDSEWDFSLSHAGGRVALALCRGHGVGVDLEPTGSIASYTKLPRSIARSLGLAKFTEPGDDDRAIALSADERWTMCEAYAKCYELDVLDALRSQTFRKLLLSNPHHGWVTGPDCTIYLSKIHSGCFQLGVCRRGDSKAIRIVDFKWPLDSPDRATCSALP